jgi:hypothetical protein
MLSDALQLKDFLTLGSNGLLTFFLYSVWKRLNTVTDVLIENGKQSAAERAALARAQGLDTQELAKSAAQIRRTLERQEETH